MSTITAALDLQTLQLGAAIRASRLANGLTLVELARLSNLSHPFLSQLERGHARPSMASLERIARALDTSQLDLLAGASAGVGGAGAVSRAHGGATVIRSVEGTRGPYAEGEGRLLVDARARFQPMEFTASNAEYGDFFRHDEDEFLTVVAGAVSADLGSVGQYDLVVGDSLYFAGGTPHRWRSTRGAEYRMFIVKQRFEPVEDGGPARTTLWSRAATEAAFGIASAFDS